MAILTAGMGAATGVAKFFEGRKMQREAQARINSFEWQDLTNPFENQQVSTLGADLRTEQSNIDTATSVDALRAGGNRAIVGGLGRIQAQNNDINREIAANLDEQQKVIDRSIAQQNANNQQMMEARQANELAGYGALLGAGQQMKFGGMTDLLSTAGYLGQTDAGKGIDKSITGLFK